MNMLIGAGVEHYLFPSCDFLLDICLARLDWVVSTALTISRAT
jgi:hypothetical protein